MKATGLYPVSIAVAAGMFAQVVATRIGMPSIVLFLVSGVLLGPDGLGIIQPEQIATALPDLVSLAVTVILFEGGLALRREDLGQQGRSLLLLLSLGSLISMIGGMLAAHYILGMSWPIASLYGALMIVTGPTVVTPLLTRLTVDRPVRELLIGEGVLIDPIGAIVAIVLAEYVVGMSGAWRAGSLVFQRLAIGGAIGLGTGVVMGLALRRAWIPEPLRNPSVLASVIAAATLASGLSPEAGLMCAVTQGVVLANAGVRELNRLRQFKEEMTVLLLSFIFVLLAADLPLGAVLDLGWAGVAVVAVLIWIARPLSVFLCTLGSDLSWRQRAFVAWICPRGIVAAAVAGFFAILLDHSGHPGGERLEALVFVTVAMTVAIQGLTAGRVARLLRVDLPSMGGMIVVGADYMGRLLARELMGLGRQVALVDSNPQHCRLAHDEGLSAYQGDARSVEILEQIGVRYADTVLALTPNSELNTLVAQRVSVNFRVERLLYVSEEEAERDRRETPFPGHFPGVDEVNLNLQLGRTWIVEYQVPEGDWSGKMVTDLPFASGEFVLLRRRQDRTYVATDQQTLEEGDLLVTARKGDQATRLASVLELVRERKAVPPEVFR